MLETIQLAGSTPVMGINSNPERSRGFLCLAGPGNFRKHIQNIMEERQKPISVGRLRVRIGKRKIPYEAANDILLSHEVPARSSRYTIIYKNTSENQLSSGVWIATPLGSTAAFKAAGGRPFKIGSGYFAFIVRELESGKKMRGGRLRSRSRLEFVSGMQRMALYFDGHSKIHRLRWGDRVLIDQGGKPAEIFFQAPS